MYTKIHVGITLSAASIVSKATYFIYFLEEKMLLIHIINSLPPEKFFMLFCCLLIFFQNQIFQILSGTTSVCKGLNISRQHSVGNELIACLGSSF